LRRSSPASSESLLRFTLSQLTACKNPLAHVHQISTRLQSRGVARNKLHTPFHENMRPLWELCFFFLCVGRAAALVGNGVPPKDFMLQLIERKKYEVAKLERSHADPTDPVKLRVG